MCYNDMFLCFEHSREVPQLIGTYPIVDKWSALPSPMMVVRHNL